MDGGNESLDMNYSQVSEMGTQARYVVSCTVEFGYSATPDSIFFALS